MCVYDCSCIIRVVSWCETFAVLTMNLFTVANHQTPFTHTNTHTGWWFTYTSMHTHTHRPRETYTHTQTISNECREINRDESTQPLFTSGNFTILYFSASIIPLSHTHTVFFSVSSSLPLLLCLPDYAVDPRVLHSLRSSTCQSEAHTLLHTPFHQWYWYRGNINDFTHLQYAVVSCTSNTGPCNS